MNRTIILVASLGLLLGASPVLEAQAGDVELQDSTKVSPLGSVEGSASELSRRAAEAYAAASQARLRHLGGKGGQGESAGVESASRPASLSQAGTMAPAIFDGLMPSRPPSAQDIGGTYNEPNGSALLTTNPALSCPGYYILRTHAGTNSSAGRYGAEILLGGTGIRTLQGGLNFGGYASNSRRAFAAFSIANANNEDQLVYIGISASSGPVSLERRSSSGDVTYIDVFHQSGTAEYQATVPPGFYVVNYTPSSGFEDFAISALTSYVDRPGGGFQGGAVFGGLHSPGVGEVTGYAGFCIANDFEVDVQIFSTPTYSDGAQGMAFSLANSDGTVALDSRAGGGGSPPGTTDDHGDSCSTATPLYLSGTGQYRSGTATLSIDEPGDHDFFEVYLPSNANLIAYTTDDSQVDSVGRLYDSSCTAIAENDDGGEGLNFGFERDLVQGTYYISVRDYYSSTSSGTTELKVDVALEGGSGSGVSHTLLFNNDLIYAANVWINGVHQGSIAAGGDVDYSYSGPANADIELQIIRPTTPNGTAVGLPVTGTLDLNLQDGGTTTIDFDWTLGSTTYYAPVIRNNSGFSLTPIVHPGLVSEYRCPCTIPSNNSYTSFGYYQLYSNSSLEVENAGNPSQSWLWSNYTSSVNPGDGVLYLNFE